MKYAWEQVVFTAKKVVPYILAGVAVGAFIHNWIPEDFVVRVLKLNRIEEITDKNNAHRTDCNKYSK